MCNVMLWELWKKECLFLTWQSMGFCASMQGPQTWGLSGLWLHLPHYQKVNGGCTTHCGEQYVTQTVVLAHGHQSFAYTVKQRLFTFFEGPYKKDVTFREIKNTSVEYKFSQVTSCLTRFRVLRLIHTSGNLQQWHTTQWHCCPASPSR